MPPAARCCRRGRTRATEPATAAPSRLSWRAVQGPWGARVDTVAAPGLIRRSSRNVRGRCRSSCRVSRAGPRPASHRPAWRVARSLRRHRARGSTHRHRTPSRTGARRQHRRDGSGRRAESGQWTRTRMGFVCSGENARSPPVTQYARSPARAARRRPGCLRARPVCRRTRRRRDSRPRAQARAWARSPPRGWRLRSGAAPSG